MIREEDIPKWDELSDKMKERYKRARRIIDCPLCCKNFKDCTCEDKDYENSNICKGKHR